MNSRSLPRLLARALTLSVAFVIPAASLNAQIPSASALRATPNEVEREDQRVSQVIARAESHFNQGQLNLRDNKREQARDEFDKAVDAVLESGLDVRANPRLQNYYLQLVERIYRIEIPAPQSARPATQLAQNAPAAAASQQQLIAVNTTPQEPAQEPQIGFRQQRFEPSPLDELSRLRLTPEEQNVSPDSLSDLELARSAVDFPFNTNSLIQQFINYYQGRGRGTMESGLRRSGRYMNMARRIFREEGVPEDIAWLGQVESAWRPTALSHAAASGLWQFIPSTGARFGLRQTAWVDERNGFEQATRASARYLRWLANRYNGNWELAMAAYNTGEGNVDRAIARAGSADFWQIYPYIAQETRNYVPNILATILIAKNPERYGFRNIRPEAPLAFDVVSVPSATSLQLIADITETSLDYIRSLNPELRRDTTPPGSAYNLRLPPGRARGFVALLNRIPVERRNAARLIRVSAGEDLQAVAQRTGNTVATLQMWNNGVDLSNGGHLVVPGSPVRTVAMVRPRPNASEAASAGTSLIRVRARAGDTVASLAARHSASAAEVARINGLAVGAILRNGQELRVPSTGARASAPARRSAAPARRRR